MTKFESHLRIAERALNHASRDMPDDIDYFTRLRINFARKKVRAVIAEQDLKHRKVSNVNVKGGLL